RGRGGGSAALPDQRQPVESALLPRNPENLSRYASVQDTSASLELRARTYLAVNCASCHTVSGGGNSAMNFEWGVSATRMQALGERPQHGDFGLTDARV